MYCCCCSSLRGAAYFVTSIQMFVGLHQFLKWGVITVIKGTHEEYFQDNRQQILYPMLLIYLCLVILLGSVNFLAVQKENGKILKWCTRILLLLAIGQLLAHLLLGFLPDEDEDPTMTKVWHLQRFFPLLGGSIAYFGVLFMYSRNLLGGVYLGKRKKDFEIEDRYYDPPNKDLDKEEKSSKKKSNKKSKKMKVTDEEASNSVNLAPLHPSAPPPTPGPSANEADEDPAYMDADDVDFEPHVMSFGVENEYSEEPGSKLQKFR